MRIVALINIRNEELYIARCIAHLWSQGVETCVIDHESTDRSLEIANAFRGNGVCRVETLSFDGIFDLEMILKNKERLARDIKADWFIHQDADEIREAPKPYSTLKQAIQAVDLQGFNAINFDEFVFLPTSDEESFEGTDYLQTMRYYYFHEPSRFRQVKCWKKGLLPVDLASNAGHDVQFPGRKIFPVNFTLRHYMVLSRQHAVKAYQHRVHLPRAVNELGWHGPRARFNAENVRFPDKRALKCIDDRAETKVLDKSEPWLKHTWFGIE